MASSIPTSTTPDLVLPSVKLNTGADMPLFGLGTWLAGVGEVRTAVTTALESGYKAIDCAAGYGNEHEVGAALEDCISRGVCKREDVFITSKLWAASAWPDLAIAALDKTLADLKTPYLDLYLIHWPYLMEKGFPTFPAPEEKRLGYDAERYLAVWRFLEGAVDAGKINAIGTSNMIAKKMDDLLKGCRIKPAVNQVESHPFLTQDKLIKYCTKRGIVVTAFSPLGSPARPARLVAEGDPTPLYDPTILAIAAKHKKTAAHVLIRWQIQRGVVVIPKSVTPARIIDNGKVGDFLLSDEDMAAISALNTNQRLNKGGSWTTAGQSWTELWDEDYQEIDA
jgi:aldehyde reductase